MSNMPWADMAEAKEIFEQKIVKWNMILKRIRDHKITTTETLRIVYEEKLYFYETTLISMVKANQEHSPESRQLVIDTLEKYILVYKQLIEEINKYKREDN